MRTVRVFAYVAFTLFWMQDASARIHRYRDAHGVVHFTNTQEKPPSRSSSKPKRSSIRRYRDAHGVVHFTNTPRARRRSKAALLDPDRFSRYNHAIYQASKKYRVSEALIRAVIRVESNYNPHAISPVGAKGLMQLMPSAAKDMQVRRVSNPRDNIFGGTRLLRTLANRFKGDFKLTLAAYHAGPVAVLRRHKVPLSRTTRNYVKKVLYYYHRYRTISDVIVASRG